MWRTTTSRKGQNIVNAARKLATESAPPKQNLPPLVAKPPSQSGGSKALKLIGLSLPLAAGGVVGYAWYDADFRRQLEDNIPYTKNLFESILPKDDGKPPAAIKQSQESFLEKASVLNAQEEAKRKAAVPAYKRTDDQTQDHGITTSLPGKDKKSATAKQLERREDDDKSDNAALEVVIHKLTVSSQNLIAEAVKAQTDVATSIRNQTRLLKQAMDDTSDILAKDSQWEAVAAAYKERELAILRANDLLMESKKSVERLRDILHEGVSNRVTQNNPAIIPAKKQLNDFLTDLGNATAQVRQAEAEANILQKYKDLVEKGKKHFQQEIQMIIPPEKFSTGKKLSEEDLNLLVGHAHSKIEQLQKQIAEQITMERQRLAFALEAQRQNDIKGTHAALAEERQHLLKEFEVHKSIMETEYSVQLEEELRKQLARQSAAHSDHLRDALATQEVILSDNFKQKLQAKLLEEKGKVHSNIAGWISRLKGIEAAVEARVKQEKLARSAQDLWLACISLNSAIQSNDDSEYDGPKPLKKHIDLILEAGHKHPFVETLVNAFPQTALLRGVNTEDEIRCRFFKVSRICRRLGLVDASNASMYKYLISYLHSFVVLDNVVANTEEEKIDLTNLDNFDLLSNANYWMARGHLDIALTFMVQLTGESRRAASSWIAEAQLLLETKQITNTLMAYATATGLENTF